MPPHPAVTGVIVVASLAVATAVAIYESHQARQFTEEIRRKIAIALHSLGDEINPGSSSESPRFNRPEDADGFLQTQGRRGSDAHVQLDEDSQRRQRDELIYWNAMKMAQDKDKSDEDETNPYNTGARTNVEADQGLRNRGRRGSALVDPFNDAHTTDSNPLASIISGSGQTQQQHEAASGLYSTSVSLVNVSDSNPMSEKLDPRSRDTFGIPDPVDKEVYTSIHAWAESASVKAASSPDEDSHEKLQPSPVHSAFGVVQPTSPTHNKQNIHASNDGDATPTDVGSIMGSEGTAWDRNFDVLSVNGTISLSGESNTPGNWSEIGSVISEDDIVFN
ncbi:hypothetical protein K3495_g10122 [Podosphaera aphanis]|nr:hypothetical protein K3495_g10122 [Podosphaera aphanis]